MSQCWQAASKASSTPFQMSRKDLARLEQQLAFLQGLTCQQKSLQQPTNL
jgi:hypothetical protein